MHKVYQSKLKKIVLEKLYFKKFVIGIINIFNSTNIISVLSFLLLLSFSTACNTPSKKDSTITIKKKRKTNIKPTSKKKYTGIIPTIESYPLIVDADTLTLSIKHLGGDYQLSIYKTKYDSIIIDKKLKSNMLIQRAKLDLSSRLFSKTYISELVFDTLENNALKFSFQLTNYSYEESFSGGFIILFDNHYHYYTAIDSIWFNISNDISIKDTLFFTPDNIEEFRKSMGDSLHIYLKEGIYSFDHRLYINNNNVIIEGLGKVYFENSSANSSVIGINSFNIKLKNLHIRHRKTNNLDSNCCTGIGVIFDIAEHIYIEDCDISCGEVGIASYGYINSNIYIRNCDIHNNSITAIPMKNDSTDCDNSYGIILENNIFSNNGHGRTLNTEKDFMKDGIVLKYPNFDIKIFDFWLDKNGYTNKGNEYSNYDNYDTYGKDNPIASWYYPEDPDFTKPLGLTIKKDTFWIEVDLEYKFPLFKNKITPLNSTDIFKISYTYNYELGGNYFNNDKKNDEIILRNQYPYKEIPTDSTLNFILTESEYLKNKEFLKNKYNLRDTSVIFSGECSSEAVYVDKRGRLYFYSEGAFYIKIDRLENNKVIESKIIVINQEDWDC